MLFRANYLILLFILLSLNIQSQILINEYSCSNRNILADNYGEYEDWIELYNTTSTPVNLAGYYLSDKTSNPAKWMFPGGTVPANGFIVVFASGRDMITGGYIHTNFKLTQTNNEPIILSNPSGVVIDDVTTEPALKNHSRGRVSDGSATWGIFTAPTPGASNGGAYQDYTLKPVFSQPAGFYGSSINISISSPTSGCTLHYTTDGSLPSVTSPVYTSPVSITSTTVLRAVAISSNPQILPGFVESNTYFINENHSMAVVSVFGNQLNALLGGAYIDADGGLEYFDKNKQLKAEGYGEFNKHGNDSWAYQQRGIDYITRDQHGYTNALKHKLFSSKDRTEFQRIILKAAANDNYPFENGGAHIRDAYVHTLSAGGDLYLDERTYEPCVLYNNGMYWGLYEIREKVDDADFIDYYYNSSEKDIQYIKTWGGTWAEYGGNQALTDWNTLRAYIMSNDMSVQANYDFVDKQYNVKSLVDYFVLNSYVVCMDWLNWNTSWWRGINPGAAKKKWRYTLWDMDAVFGHYINYTGIPDISPFADPCNPEYFPDPGGQGHVEILNALLDNPGFKQYYIMRYADLSNSVFSCDNMIHVLDSLLQIISPEMPAQINRWGGTINEWQANVQAMKNFINARCNAISQGMISCYQLTGPFDIIIDVEPPGAGTVKINSIDLPVYPWSGTYYGALYSILQAYPTAGTDYYFDYWESTDPVNPVLTQDSVTIDFTAPQTVIAHFKKDEIIDSLEVVFTNIFTPNGDGINDYFGPEITGNVLPEGKMQIFNRWGNLMYATSDLKKPWDGKTSGKDCSPGVYFWIISYKSLDNTIIERKGFLELIR